MSTILNLENLSIPKQTMILSGLAIFCIVAITIVSRHFPNNGDFTLVFAFLGISVVGILCFVFNAHVVRRTEILIETLHALGEGDLSKRCPTQGNDEFARIGMEYESGRKKFSKMFYGMTGQTTELLSAADRLSAAVENSLNGIGRQNSEIENVAAAMNEMSTTVTEVAQNAATAEEAVQIAHKQADEGNQVVQGTISTINVLAEEVRKTSGFIDNLKDESDRIGAVLDVIRGIAEQTNLLALNAAIEAARAGEQGRGFAVVADEVRELASRTQQSTQEIQGMIERLQAGANDAVNAMIQGQNCAENSVGQAAKAGNALGTITEVVNRVTELNITIASAAEKQSSTTTDINRNVGNINEISRQTALGAQESASASKSLSGIATELKSMVNQFKLDTNNL